jgi:hypothetical protein
MPLAPPRPRHGPPRPATAPPRVGPPHPATPLPRPATDRHGPPRPRHGPPRTARLTPPSMTIYQDLTRMYRAGDILGACKKELTRKAGAVQTAMGAAAASRLKGEGRGRTRATTTKGLPPAEDYLEEDEEGAEDDVPVQRKAKQSKKANLVANDLKGFGFKRLMTAPTPEIDRLTALHRLRNGAPKAEAVRSLCEMFGKPVPSHKRLADDTSFGELSSDDTHSMDSRQTKSSSRSRSDSPAMMHTPQQQHQPYADHELVKQVKALQQQVSQTLGQQQKVVQLEKEKEDMARLLQQERAMGRQQQLKERTSASCLHGNTAAEPSNPRDMALPRHGAPTSNFGGPHYDYNHGSIPSSFGPPSNAPPNHFASREHDYNNYNNYNNYSSSSFGQPPMNAPQPPNYYAPPRSAPQVHPHALPPSQMAAMSRELTGLKAARMAELEHDMRLAQGWHMY